MLFLQLHGCVRQPSIQGHALWGPILHVPEYWAVERTHVAAKTTSQATMFVDEAFRFIPSIENNPLMREVFQHEKHEIYAGLNIFAARRYIDAGKPREALGYFWQAFCLKPAVVIHYWYKLIQALGGSMSLIHI